MGKYNAILGFMCVLVYMCVLVPLIMISFNGPWFVLVKYNDHDPWYVSTNGRRIKSCCQLQFNITGYLFKDYEMSTNFIQSQTTCYNKTYCMEISSDIIDQIYNYTKLKEDTLSARSTLTFIRVSPWLIISHCPIYIIYLLTRCFKLKKAFVLLMSIMSMLTILATTCVGVYKNLIGFRYRDRGSGWWCSLLACLMTIIFDLIHMCITYSVYTNLRMKHRDKSKITTDNWIFVEIDDSNTVLDIPMTSVISEITYILQHNEVVIDLNERSMDELQHCFQKIIDNMWNQRLVGKGADAKHLSHANIRVDKVEPGHNDNITIVAKYMGFRSVIYERMKRCGHLQYLNDKPIQTTNYINTIPNSCTSSTGHLNTDLNECFLFHGTSESNADNILKGGFDITKVKSSFLGKGMYFAESHVKADQYTDASSTKKGCLLFCRVILGNCVVRKTPPGNELGKWIHLPCSRCLKVECSKHLLAQRFDSLIYDAPGGLFREFVVFNTDQILVESVIKYSRIT